MGIEKKDLKPGDRIINLKDKKAVYATKTAKHYKEGAKIVCHPEVANFMLKHGWAIESSKKSKE